MFDVECGEKYASYHAVRDPVYVQDTVVEWTTEDSHVTLECREGREGGRRL